MALLLSSHSQWWSLIIPQIYKSSSENGSNISFCGASVFLEAVEHLSRQCYDFHGVRLAFGPLLAFEASLWQGNRTGWRCCGADGEREEVCEGQFWGGELRREHCIRLPSGFVFSLRLLASPVEAAGGECVMAPKVAPAVGHAQTVARLSGEGHLHRNGTLQWQSPSCWLETWG